MRRWIGESSVSGNSGAGCSSRVDGVDSEAEGITRDGPTAEELSAVLESIYDAALDPERWTGAVEKIGAFINCSAGSIVSVDVLHLDTQIFYTWGYAPKFQAVLSENAKTNGLLRQSLRFDICEVATLADTTDVKKFYETEAYQRWAQPQGIIDVIQVILDRSATSVALMALSRFNHNGAMDENTRRRMTLLAPHVRRAFLIGKTIDLKRAQSAMLAEAIDGLAAGVFLVDGDMHLIHANVSGHAMLSRDLLAINNGLLRATEPKANRALMESVAAAARGDIVLTVERTAIALTMKSGERFSAHVLPVGSGNRRHSGTGYTAAAAIFIRATALNLPAPIQSIAALYALTTAETRVLMLIVDVSGVPPVAALLGLSEATVKTHLRSIFRKTGTKGQAELVKLVAGHASPLA